MCSVCPTREIEPLSSCPELGVEVWKPIPQFEGYFISTYARVYSNKSNQLIVSRKFKNNVVTVPLRRDGWVRERPIHRIMGMVFLNVKDISVYIKHRDGNYENNILSNLYRYVREPQPKVIKKPRSIRYIGQTEQECSGCHIIKPFAHFGTCLKSKSGHKGRCKDCHLQYQKAYLQKLRGRHQLLTITEQECLKCLFVKPISEFRKDRKTQSGKDSWCRECRKQIAREYAEKNRAKNIEGYNLDDPHMCSMCGDIKQKKDFSCTPSNKSGLSWACKDCKNRMERNIRKTDPEVRFQRVIRCFPQEIRDSFSYQDYQAMWDKQKGCCAICLRHENEIGAVKFRKLAIDHCHVTNRVRGLVCTVCNVELGTYERITQNVERHEKVVQYLKKP